MKKLCRAELENMIPHRDAMLLVDELTLFDDGIVEGSYCFSGSEWFFQGHFPGKPIVPGIILCEIMAQSSCGILSPGIEGKIPYLISIQNTKFRKTVIPGDTVVARGRLKEIKGPFYFVSCKAFVQNTLCAEGEMSFVLREYSR